MRARRAAGRGFTLVELMVALVLGLVVVGGAITVFAGSRATSTFNATLTELQENARFAMDSIVRDVRMAGFQGCVDINTATATVRGDGAPTTDLFDSAVTGSLVAGPATWSPAGPIGFVPPEAPAPGVPVPGTHALSVQFGSPETHRILKMPSAAAPVTLTDATAAAIGLATGDFALVSNCQSADLFRVTGTADASIAHEAAGNGGDGRLTAAYGEPLADADGDGVADDATRSRVMRFEANVYYVGDTGRTNAAGDPVRSLYRQTLPYSRPPIEMVEGVGHLALRLGFRDPALGDALAFVRPGAGPLPSGRVEVVEIGLLVESFDPVLDAPDARGYALAGLTVSPGAAHGAGTYANDRRLRRAFNTTVSIRNRR